jgi:hypothetical protein
MCAVSWSILAESLKEQHPHQLAGVTVEAAARYHIALPQCLFDPPEQGNCALIGLAWFSQRDSLGTLDLMNSRSGDATTNESK